MISSCNPAVHASREAVEENDADTLAVGQLRDLELRPAQDDGQLADLDDGGGAKHCMQLLVRTADLVLTGDDVLRQGDKGQEDRDRVWDLNTTEGGGSCFLNTSCNVQQRQASDFGVLGWREAADCFALYTA